MNHTIVAGMEALLDATKIATHKHYKGGLYKVHAIGLHCETREEMVIYEHLWPYDRQFWVRPKRDWDSPVALTGEVRFEPIKRPTPPQNLMKRIAARLSLWVFP